MKMKDMHYNNSELELIYKGLQTLADEWGKCCNMSPNWEIMQAIMADRKKLDDLIDKIKKQLK